MEFTSQAQNHKKRYPRFGRRLIKHGRRLCAMLLCAAMAAGGFPSAFFQAFASEYIGEYCYELESESLCDAVISAVSDGTVLEKEPDFKGGYAELYSELFDADGTLYELKSLESEKDRERDKVLDLRVFVRIEDDIPLDAEYRINGSEPVIFLLTSRSKDAVSAVICIDDLETGTIELPSAASVLRETGPGSAASTESRTEAEDSISVNSGTGSSGAGNSESGSSEAGTGSIGSDGAGSDETGPEDDASETDPKDNSDDKRGPGSGEDPAGEAGLDGGSISGSESEPDSGSGFDDGNESDGGSDSESVSGPDGGNDPDNEGDMDGGSNPDSDADTGSNEDSGSKDDSNGKNDSESNDASDGNDTANDAGSSDTGSDPGLDGSDKQAAISAHKAGLLTSSVSGYAAEDADETDDDIAADIASPSQAEAESDDADLSHTGTTTERIINGELCDAVLLGGRRSAVAFVTTAEDLGLNSFNSLRDQTLQAAIYADASYDMRLADGTSITLTGMMPEDAEAKAYPVDVEIDGVNILAAYDITIFGRNGREFQPEDDVIEVLIENDAIYEALGEDHELTVYHMEDEYDEPEEIALIEPAPKRLQILSFPAERFSIYIVGEDGSYTDKNGDEVDVYTVNFYEYVFDEESLRPSDPVSVQKVAGDDYLLEPYVPEVEHHVFDGWFTSPQDENHWDDHEHLPGYEYDFGKTVSENLKAWTDYSPGPDNVISLYSDYDPIYYVYYMTQEKEDAAGNTEQPHNFYTDEYHENDSVLNTSAAGSLYRTSHLSAQEAVTNWYYYDAEGHSHYIDDEDQLNNNGDFVVENDLTLYPVVVKVIWIYFDLGEEAGENIETPDPYYLPEETERIGELPKPQIPGYSFTAWYVHETAAGGATGTETEVGPDSYLKDLVDQEEGYITLYAHWEAALVSYTINIWRQKATDGVLGIEQKTVSPGETYDEYITYYDYAENVVVPENESKFKTGETPDISALLDKTDMGTVIYYDLSQSQQREEHPYNCFEYNEERTKNDLASKTMAADGSTVLNVFYDRTTVTWTFRSSTSSSATTYGTLIGLYGTNVTPVNGSDPAGDMSAWPEYVTNTVWGYANNTMIAGFETYYVLKNDTIPNTITFTATTGGNQSATNYFYLEVTNEAAVMADTEKRAEAEALGVDYIKHINEKDYVYGTTHTHYWSGNLQRTITFDDKFIGYTVCGYGQTPTEFVASQTDGTADISNGSITYIYNDAEEYEIDIWSNNGTTLINVGQYKYKYGADLSGFVLPKDLDPLTYGPNYYYHLSDTWYSDPSLSAEFTLPSSMPCNNLVIYAGWELNEVKVTFESDVRSDLKEILEALYPGEVEVISDDEGGPWVCSVTIPAGRQLADGLDEGLTHKADEGEDQHQYDFGGWMNLESNEVFNLNSHIYTDITLKAFWTEEETMYYIRYNINNESYSGESVVLGTAHDLSSYARVKKLTEAFEEAFDLEPDFICWNTEEEGTGTDIYPDDEISFADVQTKPVPIYDDVTGEFLYYVYVYDLYAKWTGTRETSLILEYNYPAGYEPEEDENPSSYTDIDKEFLENLASVNLGEHSELVKTTITVGDKTYVFVGWAYTENSKTAAVAPGATVAVDDLGLGPDSSEKNILYGVWTEIPVKEITFVNGSGYDGGPVAAGDEITYTITYTNYTDSSALITITDVLDKGLDYVSSVPDGFYDNDTHTVTWTIPDVDPIAEGEDISGSVTLTVRVNANAEAIITNMAGVQVGDDAEIDTDPVEVFTGARLPDTGGRGTLPFTLAGLLMLGGAVLTYLALRRRVGA